MPIKIPVDLPATGVLNNENIFVMDEKRAYHQDIRPLQIVILNLMPTKIITETQILRLLGNTALQVEVCLLHSRSHICRNTSPEHLLKYYNTIDEIMEIKFDGMIITGAPVERLDFNEVDYFKELTEIMDWSRKNVYSTLHLCWGAQAALYHHYGVPKHMLKKKLSGIFSHTLNQKHNKLLRGFDDEFFVPHSRYTEIKKEDLEKVNELEILSQSEDAGIYIVAAKDGRQFFVTGHAEYDPHTLKLEYERDLAQGLHIDMPRNYFPGNDSRQEPVVKWRGHANLLFANWLNYYVYQETPYDLNKIQPDESIKSGFNLPCLY